MKNLAGQLPTLIDAIFDGAESPQGLTGVLTHIADLLRADFGHSLVIQEGSLVDSHDSGGDRALVLEYERDWQDKDPRHPAAARAFGRVLSDVEVIDARAFERSALYNEHLRKSDFRYSLFAHAAITPELTLGQAFMRKLPNGPFAPEDVQSLDALMPSLRRALHLRHLMLATRDAPGELRRTLDAMPGAVAVVDAAATLRCANAAAERLFAAGDGLVLDRGKISSSRSSEAQALAAALRATARSAEGSTGRTPRSPRVIMVARERARPLGIVLAPLRPVNALRRRCDRHARVLIAFHDPDARLCLDPALVAQLHGFTEVEALLAVALVRGLTLADFSHERSCSEHTARTHLKRMLEKSGARRQTDLVRMLLGSTAVHLSHG